MSVGQAISELVEIEDVRYDLTITGSADPWVLESIAIEESLLTRSTATITAKCPNSTARDGDFLARNVDVRISRGTSQRHFRGLIRQASVRRAEVEDFDLLHLDVVPAFWLTSQTIDSRIYQNQTVPAIVELLVRELIGQHRRTVRLDLQGKYAAHEYIVQYRESYFAFIQRICHDEGIYLYFDHESGEHEELVLADSNHDRPQLFDYDGARLYAESSPARLATQEAVFSAVQTRRVGSSGALVGGYDWTNSEMLVRAENSAEARSAEAELSVYDPHESVRYTDYDESGAQHTDHSAERKARMLMETLELARRRWTLTSSVVSAKVGHVFRLVGTEMDDEYLIVALSGHGHAASHGRASGEYSNTLDVVPRTTPFRPPLPGPRLVPGPETALVVGANPEEIHTDPHGRIKVQFHWDRRGKKNENSSAWLRVSQAWAGDHWGFLFLPRVGMEVIVQFLGGDVDRPFVAGCLYNSRNRPPMTLPGDKTISGIRTNSSLGGGGFNELSFEDLKDAELVYLHAQRNFDEVVENDHSTTVNNDQFNTVIRDQAEKVQRDQTLIVNGKRDVTVDGTETIRVHDTRTTTIDKTDTLDVLEDQAITIGGPTATLDVTGKYLVTATKQMKMTVGDAVVSLKSSKIEIEDPTEITLVCKSTSVTLKSDQVSVRADAKITLQVGSSKLVISSGKILLDDGSGGKLTLSGTASLKGTKIASN